MKTNWEPISRQQDRVNLIGKLLRETSWNDVYFSEQVIGYNSKGLVVTEAVGGNNHLHVRDLSSGDWLVGVPVPDPIPMAPAFFQHKNSSTNTIRVSDSLFSSLEKVREAFIEKDFITAWPAIPNSAGFYEVPPCFH